MLRMVSSSRHIARMPLRMSSVKVLSLRSAFSASTTPPSPPPAASEKSQPSDKQEQRASDSSAASSIAERTFQRMQQLPGQTQAGKDRHSASAYVMMANIYASAGRHNEA